MIVVLLKIIVFTILIYYYVNYKGYQSPSLLNLAVIISIAVLVGHLHYLWYDPDLARLALREDQIKAILYILPPLLLKLGGLTFMVIAIAKSCKIEQISGSFGVLFIILGSSFVINLIRGMVKNFI